MNVDIAPDGSVRGIELLNANEQLAGGRGLLTLTDSSTGQRVEIPLPGDAA